ncbi:MAG: hypothetical protein AAGF11_56750, partial [Myxococcota bacterium]
MPSAKHQSLVRLVTEGPGVLSAVLALVGIDVPDELELQPGPDAVRYRGTNDYVADGTIVGHGVVGRGARKAREAFIVEAQLNPHASKSFTWPLYVVVVRHRLRCRTTLVVLTDSDSVARWA